MSNFYSWNQPNGRAPYKHCERCFKDNPYPNQGADAKNRIDGREFFEDRVKRNLYDWWLCDDCLLKYQW